MHVLSRLDVWTMTLMDGRIAEAAVDNPGLRAFALINLASSNPRQSAMEETRLVLEQGCSAMEVAEPTLCDRVAFQRPFAIGRTVEEYGARIEKAGGQGMRGTAKEPRNYIAFRPPESVARKIHLVATGRSMIPIDYILECTGDRIGLDFADLAAHLREEVG